MTTKQSVNIVNALKKMGFEEGKGRKNHFVKKYGNCQVSAYTLEIDDFDEDMEPIGTTHSEWHYSLENLDSEEDIANSVGVLCGTYTLKEIKQNLMDAISDMQVLETLFKPTWR